MGRDDGYWQRYYAEHRDQRLAESKAYQAAHADERKSYMAEYYRLNPDKFPRRTAEQQAEYNRRRRERYAIDAEYRERAKKSVRDIDPAVKREQRIRRQYGIGADDFDRMLADQEGACAICGAAAGDSTGRRFAIDHCHVTGAVRGLLCSPCNMGIGQLGDDPTRMDRAAMYLRTHQRATGADQ